MKRVPLDELVIGSIIGTDVIDDSGNVLLGQGTSVTDRHKSILTRRGIESVMVIDGDTPEDKEETDQFNDLAEATEDKEDGVIPAITERLAAIEHAFSDCQDHPLMSKLRERIIQHVARGELDD